MLPSTPAAEVAAREDARLRDLLVHLKAAPVEEWPAVLRVPSLPDVATRVSFDPTRDTRTLLAADEDVEILLMGWLPGQASPIHDHGNSQGAALVLAGEAHEETFDASTGRARRPSASALKRGQATLERRTDVHRVSNPTAHLLVTLHAYGPRLTESATYEE